MSDGVGEGFVQDQSYADGLRNVQFEWGDIQMEQDLVLYIIYLAKVKAYETLK
jgi:hypothetical protein